MNESIHPQRLVVGITDGPGTRYAIRLLEALRESPIETHLVISAQAGDAVSDESGLDAREIRSLASRTYAGNNQAARISSGSFLTLGMVVVPCSNQSLASIAMGLADDLVHRAADVTIKEGRPLLLMVARESRWHDIGRVGDRLSMIPSVEVRPELVSQGDRLADVDGTVAGILGRFSVARFVRTPPI